MVIARILIAIIFFFSFSLPVGAIVTPSNYRVWQLPMVEMREVVEGWFANNKFAIEGLDSDPPHERFLATRGMEHWWLTLTPSSSLATKVTAVVDVHGREQRVVNKLWEYLAVYTGTVDEKSDNKNVLASEAVKQKVAATVLLRTRDDSGEDQFSGFFIGSRGTVLSTAHGLNAKSMVWIFTADGKEHPARLIKMDKTLDLAILQTNVVPTTFVPFEDTNFVQHHDGLLFAISNPLDVQGIIATGNVYGGVRMINHVPLWQLEMSVYPGSSGGPVFTNSGKLVGVVKGRHRTIPDITFMIPIETIAGFLKGE